MRLSLLILNSIAAAQQVMLSPIPRGWNSINTTSVNYRTFYTILQPNASPFLGPKGLYTTTDDGGFAYVDMFPGGELETKDRGRYMYLVDMLTKTPLGGLEFIPGNSRNVGLAGCGDICADSRDHKICEMCSCRLFKADCRGYLDCVNIWTCQ
jgi:hypothetical protein